jgi:hypothetical protein
VVVRARGLVDSRVTPGPRRWVARSVCPSGAQASVQGSRGVAAVAVTERAAASTSTTSSSCEQATNTFVPSALTTTPIGSEQTATLPLTEAEATSTA